ncbi:hypothetical protein LX81_02999 [Palleronia aestuarii]|uniref:Uncharacterized protein n=1 Tax=Palleronia aestuarii TaxID=568105 RepID=A0A2W7N2B7_9RHOB|nr:hypothetical protein LX81_02999 [Palleronia aestuarii]
MPKASKDTALETATDAIRSAIAKFAKDPAQTSEVEAHKPVGTKRQRPGKKMT